MKAFFEKIILEIIQDTLVTFCLSVYTAIRTLLTVLQITDRRFWPRVELYSILCFSLVCLLCCLANRCVIMKRRMYRKFVMPRWFWFAYLTFVNCVMLAISLFFGTAIHTPENKIIWLLVGSFIVAEWTCIVFIWPRKQLLPQKKQ